MVHFFLLKICTNHFNFFCINVISDFEIYLFLFSQVNDLLGPSMFIIELFSDVLLHVRQFMRMLLFQLFYQVKSSWFVVTHVLVPSLWKLLILQALCIFNVYEFSLLSDSHIMLLSLLFILTPSVENFLKLICHHVVALDFVSFSYFVHDSI